MVSWIKRLFWGDDYYVTISRDHLERLGQNSDRWISVEGLIEAMCEWETLVDRFEDPELRRVAEYHAVVGIRLKQLAGLPTPVCMPRGHSMLGKRPPTANGESA